MMKKYKFVRMPNETYDRYYKIKLKMEADIAKLVGRKIPLPMTKVFKAVASPEFNENFIQIDLPKLVKLAREKKR